MTSNHPGLPCSLFGFSSLLLEQQLRCVQGYLWRGICISKIIRRKNEFIFKEPFIFKYLNFIFSSFLSNDRLVEVNFIFSQKYEKKNIFSFLFFSLCQYSLKNLKGQTNFSPSSKPKFKISFFDLRLIFFCRKRMRNKRKR